MKTSFRIPAAEIRQCRVGMNLTAPKRSASVGPSAICRAVPRASTAPAVDLASDCVGEIVRAWSRGAAHTMELARVVLATRHRLRYGEWSRLWQSERMPFSKRKGEMLVAVGERLGWIDAQLFAHLPVGWSVLYWLARLERELFKRLISEGVIHPKLTLQQAKDLVAKFNGPPQKAPAQHSSVKRRVHRFREYVHRTLSHWQPEERELAQTELTRLIELIGNRRVDDSACDLGDGWANPLSSQKIFTIRHATGLSSSQTSQTTV